MIAELLSSAMRLRPSASRQVLKVSRQTLSLVVARLDSAGRCQWYPDPISVCTCKLVFLTWELEAIFTMELPRRHATSGSLAGSWHTSGPYQWQGAKQGYHWHDGDSESEVSLHSLVKMRLFGHGAAFCPPHSGCQCSDRTALYYVRKFKQPADGLGLGVKLPESSSRRNFDDSVTIMAAVTLTKV